MANKNYGKVVAFENCPRKPDVSQRLISTSFNILEFEEFKGNSNNKEVPDIDQEELEARIEALNEEIDKLLNLRRNRHEKGKEDRDADKYMAMCMERARLRGLLH